MCFNNIYIDYIDMSLLSGVSHVCDEIILIIILLSYTVCCIVLTEESTDPSQDCMAPG